MKLPAPFASLRRSPPPARQAAFTLPEMLIATAVFSLLVGGILGGNLFGLRMCQITQTKLSATDQARIAIGRITDEIRSGNTIWVGSVSNGVFVGHLDGEPQTGTSLLIYPTTNRADFIVYFVNPSDQTFRRSTSAAGSTTILAHSITNTLVFGAVDPFGNVRTNNQNTRLVHLCLEFYSRQAYLPTADSYTLEAMVARRAL
jgi:prepilin-type N-terminal cleavage/methylation domain-containing protein